MEWHIGCDAQHDQAAGEISQQACRRGLSHFDATSVHERGGASGRLRFEHHQNSTSRPDASISPSQERQPERAGGSAVVAGLRGQAAPVVWPEIEAQRLTASQCALRGPNRNAALWRSKPKRSAAQRSQCATSSPAQWRRSPVSVSTNLLLSDREM
jgi:hypothetical protein